MLSKYIILDGREKYILRISNIRGITEATVSPRINQMNLILLEETGKIRFEPVRDGKCSIPAFHLEKFVAAAIADGSQIVAKGEVRKTDWNSVMIALLNSGNGEKKNHAVKAVVSPLNNITESPQKNTIDLPAVSDTEPAQYTGEKTYIKEEDFNSYLFNALANKWPNSKWEKFDYPGCPDRYYLTGEIQNENGSYSLCFAIPGCAFMPYLGSSYYIEEDGNGYWLFFQESDGSFYDCLE